MRDFSQYRLKNALAATSKVRLKPSLHVKSDYFKIISKLFPCFIWHVTTSENEIKLFQPLKMFWNYFFSTLFQPSSTSVWNNFILAHGNLPVIISQLFHRIIGNVWCHWNNFITLSAVEIISFQSLTWLHAKWNNEIILKFVSVFISHVTTVVGYMWNKHWNNFNIMSK